MSEAYNDKRSIRSSIKRLFTKSEDDEDITSSDIVREALAKSQNRITRFISKLAELGTSSRLDLTGFIHSDEPMGILSYIDILARADMIPYGENVMCTLNSIERFYFEFVDHEDDNREIQKYCIISTMESSLLNTEIEVVGIFQVTTDTESYNTMDDFIKLCEECIDNGLEHFIYRHICGIILNYVKVSISRYPLLQDGLAYVLAEYPQSTTVVDFDEWFHNKIY